MYIFIHEHAHTWFVYTVDTHTHTYLSIYNFRIGYSNQNDYIFCLKKSIRKIKVERKIHVVMSPPESLLPQELVVPLPK